MSADNKHHLGGSDPSYVHWRGELLAKLAISRLPGANVVEQPLEGGFDFFVAMEGLTFFVVVKTVSSIHRGIPDIAGRQYLQVPISGEFLWNAKSQRHPVMLFLFDADTEHGRFVRLDSIDVTKSVDIAYVRLPHENVITPKSLIRMSRELRAYTEQASEEDISSPDVSVPVVGKPSPAKTYDKIAREPVVIRDAIHGDLRFTELEVALLDTPHIQRLRSCLMHPMANLVYPSMTHDRFSHALGRVAVLDQILTTLFSDAPSRLILERSLDCPLDELRIFARIAALVSDVGYLPFRVVRVVNERLSTISNATETIEAQWRNSFLTRGTLAALVEQGLPERTGRLGKSDLLDVLMGVNPRLRWLSDLVNGPMSADRCDYVLRDTYHAGFSFHSDLARVVRGFRVAVVQTPSGDTTLRLVSRPEAADSFKQLLVHVALLYERVYLHRTVRGFETYWDRVCSSLGLELDSEKVFLDTNTAWLRSKVQELALSNEDAGALVNRRSFKWWQTDWHLGEPRRAAVIQRLLEEMQDIPERSTIDQEMFTLFAQPSEQQSSASAQIFWERKIDQVRLVSNTDISPIVERLGLKKVA